MKPYEELGGLDKLKEITNTFVDTMFGDVMIGFFFRKADRDRIKTKEFEFMADLLGADVEYTGMPIKQAHDKHPIMGGQFARRKQILKETLEKYQVKLEIINLILDHTEKLKPLVTRSKKADCDYQSALEKISGK